MRSPSSYVLFGLNKEHRPYQDAPTEAIINSILNHYGDSIVIIFPRQSGKDEYLVNLKLYLLDMFSVLDVGIVEVNPTYKPQTVTALMRFDNALSTHPWTRGKWSRKSEFIRLLGRARVAFLSGDKSANVVGAAASLALFVNEAQDISPYAYDKNFEPMAASTNATRVFAGTAWTSNTLLAREMRAAREATERDKRERVFTVDSDQVRKYVPWYGQHVDNVVKRLGRMHPLVKSQYYNEPIDAQTGMFNAARLALIAADRFPHQEPRPGTPYAFLIDMAGQDEARLEIDDTPLDNPGRDSTTLSIASVDLSTLSTLRLPTYRIEQRAQWLGSNHLTVFGQIKALAERWQPRHIVIDATGVGEGMWSLLHRFFPGRVVPVKFSSSVKSEIGYLFIACIETGRFHDCAPSDEVLLQYQRVQSELLIGPHKTMRWGVPEGTRAPSTGALLHDDHVLADSLVTRLDELDWTLRTKTTIIDPQIF